MTVRELKLRVEGMTLSDLCFVQRLLASSLKLLDCLCTTALSAQRLVCAV